MQIRHAMSNDVSCAMLKKIYMKHQYMTPMLNGRLLFRGEKIKLNNLQIISSLRTS